MSGTLIALSAVLVTWMAAAGWCGFGRRYLGFVPVLLVGLGLNLGWMVWGLDAKPFEKAVLMAQAAATGYAVCAFFTGWFIGRITRELRASRVEKPAAPLDSQV